MSHFRDRIWNFPAIRAAIRSTRALHAARLVRSAAMLLAADVDVLELADDARCRCSSPSSVLSVVAGVGLVVLTTLGTPLVDKRWPADEPLDPTEMLWGESGRLHQAPLPRPRRRDRQGHQQPVHRGEGARRRGHRRAGRSGHALLRREGRRGRGRARSSPTAPSGRSAATAPGDTFGEVGILRRTPRTATIRAVTDSVVMQLPAEEFVAGVAFSAAEGNVLLARVNEYLAADAERAASVPAPAPTATVASAGGDGPAVADTTTVVEAVDAAEFAATHVVPAGGPPGVGRARSLARSPSPPSPPASSSGWSASRAPGPGSWPPTAGRAGSTAGPSRPAELARRRSSARVDDLAGRSSST